MAATFGGITMTMRTPAAFFLATLVTIAALSMAESTLAEGPRQAHYQAPAAGPGPGGWASRADFVDAHGEPAVIPAQYGDMCPPGYGGYGGSYADMPGAYGGVSFNTDQVGPHYFDVSVEYVSMKRDNGFNNASVLVANNFGGGNIVPILSTSSVSDEFEPGFRILGRYDVGPLAVLEFGYTGLYDMGGSQSAVDPSADPATGLGNFFSLFTAFGTTPPGGFDPANLEDFEETDRASSASVSFNTDLQTAEMSYRRYWVGYSPRVTGTLLAGFRYTKLKEGFLFNTVGVNFLPADADPNDPSGGIGTADYVIDADNNLAGFQLGGDVWVGVIQGLRVGAEGKLGIYNNHYEVTSSFSTTDGAPSFVESAKDDQVAFISEASFKVVADILPSLSIKGGYEVLFMNSLALAGDNFNPGSPYDNPAVPARVAFIADQGDALLHGWNLGIEYIW